VLFPVYSKLQDNKELLSDKLNKNIDILTFVLFPIMAIAIIVAGPLVEILYTAKWSDSVPYFQLLCVAGAILPVNMANLNIIKSQGKGLMYLFMQLSQFVIGVSAMLIGARWGVHGLICGGILTSYLYAFIVIHINANLLVTSVRKQFLTISKNMIVAILVGIIVFVISHNINASVYLSLIISIVAYIAIYIFTSYVFRMSGLNMCLRIIKKQK
jgi:O-antigen/teichoic acid export membrane protein